MRILLLAWLTVLVVTAHVAAADDDPPKEPAPPDPPAKAAAPKAIIELFQPIARPGNAVAKRPWGPEQVTGAPDTPGAGDIRTAWASRTPDEMDEWLELEYAQEVEPAAVIVHENYNPGAVYRITAYSKTTMKAEMWKGKDPTDTTAPRGISEIKIKRKFKTKKIRVHIKSTKVEGWNEIDAVGIKDVNGNVQWAIKARASSSYASNDQPDNGPTGFVAPPEEPDKAAILKEEIEMIQRIEQALQQQLNTIEAQIKAVQQRRMDFERKLDKLKRQAVKQN